MKRKNDGSFLEGKMTEIGGLLMQITGGIIEYTRSKTTNEPDGGIDGVYYVKDDFDYFSYIEQLKRGKRDGKK